MKNIIDEKDLNQLIEIIEETCRSQDLSDGYLIDHNQSTRHNIGIGEYAYGITMVPASWVLPYLKELKEIKDEPKDLNLAEAYKGINKILDTSKNSTILVLDDLKIQYKGISLDTIDGKKENYIISKHVDL